MKLPQNGANPAPATNLAGADAWRLTPFQDTPYFSTIRLLADIVDTALKGTSAYAVIGCTQRKDAVTLSINYAGEKRTIYAGGLDDIGAQAETWL